MNHEHPMAAPEFKDMLSKYFDAQANAPHPERDAYLAVLRSKAGEDHRELVSSFHPMGVTLGGDVVLAAGPCPNGGTELLVQKSDGVVVLLMPDMMQVKNTPKGPKNYMPQRPLELPLVRRLKPKEIVMQYCRATGAALPPALLIFQGRFSTACREINLS